MRGSARQIQLIGNSTGGSEGAGTRRWALESSTFNGSGEAISPILSELSRSKMTALHGSLYRRAGGLSRMVCAWYWTLVVAVTSVDVFCPLSWPSLAEECRRARTVRIPDRVAASGFRMGGLRVDGRVPFRLGCVRWTPTGRQREEGRWSGDGSSPGKPVGRSTYDPKAQRIVGIDEGG
jgi:hypothetical protein